MGRTGDLGQSALGDDLDRHPVAPARLLDLLPPPSRPGGGDEDPDDFVGPMPQGLADGVVAVEEQEAQTSMICCSFFWSDVVISPM